MRSNELKMLANLAKQRLMSKDYTASEKTKSKTSSYFIQNALAIKRLKAETNYITIKQNEDMEFIEKVRNLIDEDCYNPLGRLCDADYFNSLDGFQKEFYILNLSEKYNKVRNELLYG